MENELPRIPPEAVLEAVRKRAEEARARGELRLEWPQYGLNHHARMLKVLQPGDPGYAELAAGDYHGALRANGIDPDEISRSAEEYHRAQKDRIRQSILKERGHE
jgi:alpha-galactosidase/6-phospho-beta-glucosidase family protein